MEFLGVLGERFPHTYSPRINKRIMEIINVNGAYKKFELPKGKMSEFINGVKILDIRGFNVTIPYKEEVIPYLDNISLEAGQIGAVNTVVNRNGKLFGYNTDYFGFKDTLDKNNITVENKIVVILGSGGASKAIKQVVLNNGASHIYIVSRNPESAKRGSEASSRISFIDYNELKKIKGDILVNSTPVGMSPKIGVSPVGKEIIMNFDSIVDIVYNPTETEFLKLAKEAGKKAVGGLYMLVAQAVKAEEKFNDVKIDDNVISIIYKEMISDF